MKKVECDAVHSIAPYHACQKQDIKYKKDSQVK